ncbi:MAG: hypothetical protein E3J88_03905 [Anaerolineales bacterium]|nr:MAG: hypothetical protein E3J88_03905 [Anaerolineales bacterium]
MSQREPLFAGLVVDEYDNAVETTHVGDEPMYVVNDAGFQRHVPAEQVDKAVLQNMADMIEGHEDELSKAAAKMTGHDDIFSQALLENQLLNIEERFDEILAAGIPEEGRAYLGMTGFKVRINLHGELLEVVQPGMVDPGEE